MTKVIALHTVSQTIEPGVARTKDSPGRKPKTREIKAGTHFVIDDPVELEALTKAGAVRLATAADRVAVSAEQAEAGAQALSAGKQVPVELRSTATQSNQAGGTDTVTEDIFSSMTGKAADAHLKSLTDVTPPAGWKDMKVADKQAWLRANAAPKQEGAAALNADGQGVKPEAEGTATGDGSNSGGSDPLSGAGDDTGLV